MLHTSTLCGIGAVTKEWWRADVLDFCSYPKQNCIVAGLVTEVKDLETGSI